MGPETSLNIVYQHYLQRSYPSEYKRYRRHEFIIISIEDSTSMPDPAPQAPQVPRPP